MADETSRQAEEQAQQEKAELFKALADAYAFVHGQENVRTLCGTSFKDFLKARIDEIRGPHPYGLLPLLEENDKIKADFDNAIARLRQIETETQTATEEAAAAEE